MPLEKPPGVASDPFKSAKWDELARGRRFRQSDAPTLELLVQWHAVMHRCMEDLDVNDGQPRRLPAQPHSRRDEPPRPRLAPDG